MLHSQRVFRHYFARISTAIESFPDHLARELYAKKLLAQECLNEVLTTKGISSACKANILMCSIQSVIGSGSNESALRDLCNVMRKHTQLQTLTKKMMDRFGECAQFSLYHSARPNQGYVYTYPLSDFHFISFFLHIPCLHVVYTVAFSGGLHFSEHI